MAISLTCPDCQSGYELPDEDAGQLVECACGAVLTVPGAEEPKIEVRCPKCGGRYFLEASAAGTVAECACGQQLKVGNAPVAKPADTGETIPLKCPGCNTRYNIPVADAGQQVECPCGSKFRVPRDAARLASELKERRLKKQQAAAQGGASSASAEVAPQAGASSKASAGGEISVDATSVIPPELNPLRDKVKTSSPPADKGVSSKSDAGKKGASPKPAATKGDSSQGSKAKGKPAGGKASGAKTGAKGGGADWRSKASKLTADSPVSESPASAGDSAAVALPIGLPEETFLERHGGAHTAEATKTGANKPAKTSSTGIIVLSLFAVLGIGGVIGFFMMQGGGTKTDNTVAGTTNNQSGDGKPPVPATGNAGTGATQTEASGNSPTSTGTPPATTGTDVTPAATTDTPTTPPETTGTPPKATTPTPPPKGKAPKPQPAPAPEAEPQTTIKEVLTSLPPTTRVSTFREGWLMAAESLDTMGILEGELLESSKPKPEVKEQYVEAVRRSAGILEQTLKRIDSFTTVEQLVEAQRNLSYLYYIMNQHDRAVVLAGYVARKAEDDVVANVSARIAFAAQVQEWTSASEESKGAAERSLVRLGTMIEKRWPEDEQNQGVRMVVADALRSSGEYLESIKWFQKVGPDNPQQYALAQTLSGNILWSLYEQTEREAQAAEGAESTRLSQEAAGMLQQAAASLRQGVDLISKQPAPDVDLLLRAKLSLAQAELKEGHPDAALKLLTVEPHAVVTAVDVPAGTKRPEDGFQSKPYAVTVYRAIMLAQVAQNQIDDAIKTVEKLELLSEGDNKSLTGLYVQLIQQMRAEMETAPIERCEALAPAVHLLLSKVRSLPELGDSLRLWTAEQELFIAGKVSAEKSIPYFAEASAVYEGHLNSLLTGAAIPKEDTVIALRQQIATTKRMSGQFAEAAKSYYELLKLRPNTFQLQANMALCLEEMGRVEGQQELLLAAINGGWSPAESSTEVGTSTTETTTGGPPPKSPVWGWGTLSSYLSKKYRDGNSNPEDHQQLLDTRYHIARSRLDYSRADTSDAGKKQLEQSQLELEAFATLHSTLDSPGWEAVEGVYSEILKERGLPDAPLRRLTPDATPKPAA